MSFSLRCAEDVDSSLAPFVACFRRRGEDLLLEEPLFLRRNLLELFLGSLDSVVGNGAMPFGGRSRETYLRSSEVWLDVAVGWKDRIGIIYIFLKM